MGRGDVCARDWNGGISDEFSSSSSELPDCNTVELDVGKTLLRLEVNDGRISLVSGSEGVEDEQWEWSGYG
jgi:hypothetical protein